MIKELRFESIADIRKKVRSRHSNGLKSHPDDVNLTEAINALVDRIGIINANLDSTADPVLIESLVYELKSLHVRYGYLIKICKERGITVDLH